MRTLSCVFFLFTLDGDTGVRQTTDAVVTWSKCVVELAERSVFVACRTCLRRHNDISENTESVAQQSSNESVFVPSTDAAAAAAVAFSLSEVFNIVLFDAKIIQTRPVLRAPACVSHR